MNNVIEIENIQKIYQVGTQEVRALRGVTTQIKRGDYVAIMGPRIGQINPYEYYRWTCTPTAGRYVLNGTDVSHLHDDRLAEIRNKEIGCIPDLQPVASVHCT